MTTFKPSDRLPTENELMHQFNVGHSTVREAFKSLVMAGLVASRRTSGTFVPISSRGFLNDKVTWTPLLNERETLNSGQVRLALEGHAAMLVAERAHLTRRAAWMVEYARNPTEEKRC